MQMTFDTVYTTVQLLGVTNEEPIVTDDEIYAILNLCRLPDIEGLTSASTDWIPTYNLHKALKLVWELKAAKYVRSVNFSADGQNFSLSTRFEQCLTMAKRYAGKANWSIELQREDLYDQLFPVSENLATYYYD